MAISSELTAQDRQYLQRCVGLAREALDHGDEPFGSILVNRQGDELFADRNRVSEGDRTQHPEFAIARWAADHLTVEQRAAATVYTSGEHCPMCAAAHAWVGLGRIVYASSSAQLTAWQAQWGIPAGPVVPTPINEIALMVEIPGPDPDCCVQVRDLHSRLHGIENA